MLRAARNVALGLGACAVLALALDGLVAALQPSLEPGAAEGVLRTVDDEGRVHETRLIVVEDGGTLWIQSGHHFRGWYHRIERHPEVELVRDGTARAYRAVPLETPEAKEHMRALLRRRTGTLPFYLIRTFLLFADVKPVRLDPVPAAAPVPDASSGAGGSASA